ncbi:uncharacterized protein [Dermacentor andersoni]|uniref:uncharacterized protein isoform X2 n=1 Tax=Dermacentor andersoni TaxID=34620 RepID=UPI002417CE8E|nr:uncharacterized protein LOC126535434 isoform X2 [Dermacentor andersoni]
MLFHTPRLFCRQKIIEPFFAGNHHCGQGESYRQFLPVVAVRHHVSCTPAHFRGGAKGASASKRQRLFSCGCGNQFTVASHRAYGVTVCRLSSSVNILYGWVVLKGAATSGALATSAAGKRKPWDLQGRLHDLEECMKSVTGEKEQLSQQSTSRLQELEKINAELQAERNKNAQLTTIVCELESALSSWEAGKQSACAERDSLSLQLRSATQQVATLERCLADATGALAGLRCTAGVCP